MRPRAPGRAGGVADERHVPEARRHGGAAILVHDKLNIVPLNFVIMIEACSERVGAGIRHCHGTEELLAAVRSVISGEELVEPPVAVQAVVLEMELDSRVLSILAVRRRIWHVVWPREQGR